MQCLQAAAMSTLSTTTPWTSLLLLCCRHPTGETKVDTFQR